MNHLFKHILYILLVFTFFSCDDNENTSTEPEINYYEGDIELRNQEELISFSEFEYEEIKGNLYITNCTDLNPLLFLTKIQGDLTVHNCEGLRNFDGLNNISHIENLIINSNNEIFDLNGFESLISLKSLTLSYNSLLNILNHWKK